MVFLGFILEWVSISLLGKTKKKHPFGCCGLQRELVQVIPKSYELFFIYLKVQILFSFDVTISITAMVFDVEINTVAVQVEVHGLQKSVMSIRAETITVKADTVHAFDGCCLDVCYCHFVFSVVLIDVVIMTLHSRQN